MKHFYVGICTKLMDSDKDVVLLIFFFFWWLKGDFNLVPINEFKIIQCMEFGTM